MILMFSVVYKQRAIPVIWQVVKSKKGHLPESAHRDLLERLSEIVPPDLRFLSWGMANMTAVIGKEISSNWGGSMS